MDPAAQTCSTDRVSQQRGTPGAGADAQAFGHLAEPAAPATLDGLVRTAKRATELPGALRSAFVPAFRNAVDAADPMAALEYACNIAGSLEVLLTARTQVHEGTSDLGQWRSSRPGRPDVSPDAVEAQLAELQRLQIQLDSNTTLDAEIAAQVGPQVFQGQAVMGAGAPKLGKDAVGYIISQASVVVELLFVVQQARAVAGATGTACPVMTADQRQRIVDIVEPWRTRPVNFGFLMRALEASGLADQLREQKGTNGKSLAEIEEATQQQAKEVGAYADVGALDSDAMDALFEDTWDEAEGVTIMGKRFGDDDAIKVVEALQTAAPDARGPLIQQMAGRGYLEKLGNHLPPKFVEELQGSLAVDDPVAAAALAPYAAARGGKSTQRMMMDQVDGDLEDDHWLRAFGWFFLNRLHSAATFGFAGEYSDAYDSRAQGFTTDDQFSSAASKALGKAAVIGGVSALTGGVAGEFAGGAAEALGAGKSVQSLIAGGVGGFAGGVGGHFASDVYDQALNGKDGFDSFGSYMRSGAEGGIMGTALAGVSLAAGKYLPASAQRMTDIYANRYPSMTRVLESVRQTGFSSGRSVRMTVGEFLDVLGSGFGGPGGPTAYAVAGIGDVRGLPRDTEVNVRFRPNTAINAPMQMSGPKGPDDPLSGDRPVSDVPPISDTPPVSVESVEVSSQPRSAEKLEAEPDLTPEEWMGRANVGLGKEGKEALAKIRNGKTDAQVKEQFGGDLARLNNALARSQKGATRGTESATRRTEMMGRIKQSKLMEQPAARAIIERLGEKPTAPMLRTAKADLKDLIVGDVHAQDLADRYENSRVIRDVEIEVQEPEKTLEEYRSNHGGNSGGTTQRVINGEQHVYRVVTDIDDLVVAPGEGGRMRIVHHEEVKTGTEQPVHAKAQVNNAREALLNATRQGGRPVRLRAGNVDITETIDLASIEQATSATRGPSGKGFEQDLGITTRDLNDMIDELVNEAQMVKPPESSE